MTAQIFAIIAPVLLIAAMGYAWARAKMPFDTNMVSSLVFHVGGPCLLLSQLLKHRLDLSVMADIIAAGALVMLLTGICAVLFLRALGWSARAYLPAMIFPNCGNMGLPLCLFAFGDIGLALAVAYFALTSILQFSVGIAVASGRVELVTLLRNPMMWTLIVALILLGADQTLPLWIMNTLETAGGLTIPLMLLSLGTSLATLTAKGIGRAFIFSAFRIGGGFAAAVGVVALLDLEGASRGAVIIQSAMPTAVFNYLFASRYGNAPGEVAGIVLVSTLASFATLPLLLVFVLGT